MSDRKKPGVAFWATVMVAVLVAYPASYIPVCWIVDYLGTNWARSALNWFYAPLAGAINWLWYAFVVGEH